MSQSVALSTIQARVIGLCDLPSELTANTSPTAAQMLDWLKLSCSLLAGIVKEHAGHLYFTTSATISTSPGIPMVSLPVGFSDLYSVAWEKSAHEEVALLLATADQFREGPDGWSNAGAVRYRLVGNALELFPTPDAAHTLKLYYSTGLYPTSLASIFLARDGWDVWLALNTCMLVRGRQQKDASDFAGLLGKVEADIRRQLKRDRHGTPQIKDRRAGLVRPLGYPTRPD